jgi:hypothetical protein
VGFIPILLCAWVVLLPDLSFSSHIRGCNVFFSRFRFSLRTQGLAPANLIVQFGFQLPIRFCRVWKFENIFNRAGPTCQQPISILTARDGRLVPRAALFPVAAGHHRTTWVGPLIPAPNVTEEAATHSAFPLPPFGRAPRCYALHWPPLLPLLPVADEPPPELSNRAKRSALSSRPSCTKSLPAAPASEAGQQDSPAIVFLREHLAGGSLLRLFPHRPRSELYATKEFLPDHFSGRLDHSFGP